MKLKLEGVIAAMMTPFTKGGEFVNFDRVGPLAERLVKQGAKGLFPCGTTGEGMLLSTEERKTIAEEVIDAVGKKAKVIPQTGCLDTATTVELTRHARDCGAAAAAVVTPFYYAYDDASLMQYYTTVAKSVPGFPILVYNIPSCARNTITPEFLVRLVEKNENIVGIKDSMGSMVALTQMLSMMPAGFNVINGVDEYGFQAILAGCPAAVSGLSNVVCEIYVAVFNHLAKGDLKKAWKEQLRLARAATIFEYGRKAAMFKEGSRLRGFDAGHVRPPMRDLTAAELKKLAKDMEELGVL
jgi:dihydrodipicolinate synthase/N-acetylneuraminate lyase